MSDRLEVIQWATGNVGNESLKAILMHPGLELVGLRVYSGEKEGVDAGTLCGMPKCGVRATTDSRAILDTDADCVVYMPRHADIDEVCALLRSGKNVISTAFLFYAECLDEKRREKLRAACMEGRTSVHGTGIHPGFVGMVLPLALSGMSRTIDKIRIVEKADWTYYASPRITFDNMRFGRPAAEATLEANPFARFNAGIFEEQIWMLAKALGAKLDRVVIDQELVVSESSYDVLAGRVEAGTVSGQRYQWRGESAGVTQIQIDALWTLGGEYPAHWERAREGWTVKIEGEPSFRSHFLPAASFERRDLSIEDHVHASDIATAMQAVNTIAALCASPPGLRGTFELGPVHAGIGFRRPPRRA